MLEIKRRGLLKALVYTPFLGLPGFSLAAEMKPKFPPQLPKEFPKSPCFASQEDQELQLNVIDGTLPEDLFGHAFIMESLNTPENVNMAAGRGSIIRLDFSPNRVNLKRKKISTASVLAFDHFAGTKHQFKKMGLAYLSTDLGAVDFCNTNFVELSAGRLAISYDAGRPHEIDPVTLEVYSPIGSNLEWASGLGGIANAATQAWPFKFIRATAHPYFDKNTDEFFSVNFDTAINTGIGSFGSSFLDLMVWDTHFKLKKWRVVDDRGRHVVIKQAVHMLCVTRNHILIFDTPFNMEFEAMLGMKASRPQASFTPVYILKRSELTATATSVLARKVTLIKEWEHLLVNYDDYGDEITIVGASSPASDYSECLKEGEKLFNGQKVRQDLYGMIVAPMDEGEFGRFLVKVNPLSAELISGQSKFSPLNNRGWLIALQTWRGNNSFQNELSHMYSVSFGFSPELLTEATYKNYANYPHRNVALENLPMESIPSCLQRLNINTMNVDQLWDAPVGVLLSSPQFLPKKGGGLGHDEGYISCIAASDRSGQNSSGDEIWIFDAEAIHLGPICRLGHLQLNLGFTLHSTWMADLKPILSKTSSKISGFEDYNSRVQKQPPAIVDFFQKVIYPRFS